jgi:hypothetical protein
MENGSTQMFDGKLNGIFHYYKEFFIRAKNVVTKWNETDEVVSNWLILIKMRRK